MPRRPTRTVPTVLLPGPFDSDPADWQRWLADELTAAGREVRVPEFGGTELARWLPALRQTLAGLPDDGFDVVAHSLSCILWLHHALDAGDSPLPARVALVSPPSEDAARPEWASFFPAPLDIDALRKAADGTVLVGGDNDPFCPAGVALAYGAPLKMAATVIADAGAMTADTGYGEWPAVLDWCGRDNLAFRA